MHRLRDLPIKHKLTALTMLISGVALLLGCGAFALSEQANFHRSMARDFAIIADMIDDDVAPGLAFDDANAITQTLTALGAHPHIVAACVYDKEGRIAASYQRPDQHSRFRFPASQRTGQRFLPDRLDTFKDITLAGEFIGVVYIGSDLDELRARAWRYAAIVAGLLLICSLVAWLLAARLQRFVSEPIVELAQVAVTVAMEKNYSVRARKRSRDEVGRLIDGFNDMLEQIQTRDAELERRVLERTNQLQSEIAQRTREQARFQFIFERVPVGISLYSVRPDGQTLRLINEAHLRICDVTREQADDPAIFQRLSHPEDYARQLTLVRQLEAGSIDQFTVEKRYLLASGKTVWVVFSTQRQRYPDGSVENLTTVTDITRLKESESGLAYERDLLRALINSSPDTIYFKDLASRFVLVSQSKVRKTLVTVPDLRARRAAKKLPAEVPEPDLLNGLTDFDTYQDDDARLAYEDEQRIIRTGESITGKQEKQVFLDGSAIWHLTSKMPWRDAAGKIIGTFGISKDITALKAAEEKVEQMHKQLLETSRQAGMAEVATGVLHNVGNVLNSVNVSATLVVDHVRHSKAGNVAKLSALFEQHKANLADFLTRDSRGQMIPGYLGTLAEALTAEQKAMIAELEDLRKNIEHIKDIVAMQQAYARTSGVTETVAVPDMIEDAIRINAGSLARHDVETFRDYQARPVITTDKHKVIQILINLVRNAKYACDESGRTDKRITVRTTTDDHGVHIAVADNGVGIAPENLTRIFNHGFTTRQHGHGFGLHSGALAAKELGGALTVHSEGPGRGATFILELPFKPEGAS